MKALPRFVSLVGTIGPPLLFLVGRMGLDATRIWIAVCALAWFAATPFWMEQEQGRA